MLSIAAARPPAAAPLPAELHLLELLNAERREHGLPALQWNDTLADLAQGHAFDMRGRGVASHHSTVDGAGFAERLGRTDLLVRSFAENVALAPSLLEAHLWLMESPGHRQNLLDPELTHVGLGVAETWDGLAVYVVEDFAQLVPRLSSREARDAVRTALEHLPRPIGRPLVEAPDLSREAADLSREMAREGRSRAPRLPEPPHDVAYFYDSVDPVALPEMVSEVAPTALEYGVGATFAETDERPRGTYWVVLIFRDVT